MSKIMLKGITSLTFIVFGTLILSLVLLYLTRVVFSRKDNCLEYDRKYFGNGIIWQIQYKEPMWFYRSWNIVWHDYEGCPSWKDQGIYLLGSFTAVSSLTFILSKRKHVK